MKLSEIQSMSRHQISRLSAAVKKDLYVKFRRLVNDRTRSFTSRGLTPRMTASIKDMPTPAKATEAQMNAYLSNAGAYIQGTYYTYKGWKQHDTEVKREIMDRLDMPNMTDDQFKRYFEFMNAMSDMMGNAWHGVSSQASQLFAEAERLNLNASQFVRNFDYWQDHVEDLRNAKPLTRKAGVKPSDYIRQLKLESITSWRKRQDR